MIKNKHKIKGILTIAAEKKHIFDSNNLSDVRIHELRRDEEQKDEREEFNKSRVEEETKEISENHRQ